MPSQRTIKVKRYHDIVNQYEAGGAILPGDIVALQSDDTVDANTTAGGQVATMVALEDELQGNTTRDAYAEGDPVQCWYVSPGEEVLLNIDSGFDPSIGDYLTTSATAGEVQAAGTDEALFQVTGDKIIDDDDNHRVPARRV